MTRVMKHNPAFLDDDELVEGFLVRETDFDLLVETLHENTDARANQHVLVIGPRGMGKTTLARRVAIEARRDPVLSRAWYPIVFGEESYAISDAGEFWLEAILHLADDLDDPEWHALHEALLAEPDGETLRIRALARLTEFADARGVRLLLVVENLQMVLGEQLDEEAASSLRHTLQNEPRIMLLATAANRFDAIDRPEQPMFDLFRVHALEPLTEDEARTLWNAVAERPLLGRRIRPVHILTGGNPRLLSIVAAFSQKRSFAELMTDLVHLVDDHTTYFKANVEALPPGERKVLVALADLWSRATSRQVAERARLDPKKTAAYLKRLSDRGVVREVDRIGRVRLYELTERLYNIYHLMRRRGGEQAQVKALVEFMIAFYDNDELGDLASQIAAEAIGLETDARRYHLWALTELMARSVDDREREAWLKVWPVEISSIWQLPEGTRAAHEDAAGLTSNHVQDLFPESDIITLLSGLFEVEFAVTEMLTLSATVPPTGVGDPKSAWLEMHSEVWRLAGRGDFGAAIEACRHLCHATPPIMTRDWYPPLLHAAVLAAAGHQAQACDVLEKTLERDPSCSLIWEAWAATTHDPAVAVRASLQATDLAPRSARAWAVAARAHMRAGDIWAAVELWQHVLELHPDSTRSMFDLFLCLVAGGDWTRAEEALEGTLSDSEFVGRYLLRHHLWIAVPIVAGHAKEVRAVIENSPAADLLAPVSVALALHLGEPINAPREVEEVARDVLAQVEALASPAGTPGEPG